MVEEVCKLGGNAMKSVDVCPRCGSKNTDVDDYYFTRTEAVFICFCYDCMNDSESWEVYFDFNRINAIGWDYDRENIKSI